MGSREFAGEANPHNSKNSLVCAQETCKRLMYRPPKFSAGRPNALAQRFFARREGESGMTADVALRCAAFLMSTCIASTAARFDSSPSAM